MCFFLRHIFSINNTHFFIFLFNYLKLYGQLDIKTKDITLTKIFTFILSVLCLKTIQLNIRLNILKNFFFDYQP